MEKIYVAFLWHNHQPMYKNPVTSVYELPWVRLHACKDYYDTAVILENYPKIKSNFNIVPSLMVQLDEYAKGTAHDKFLDLTLKPALELTLEDKVFMLQNFFMANWDTMILPYKRYKQLLEKRGKVITIDILKRKQQLFTASEWTDLQVWFNLSWMDPFWQRNNETVKMLMEKGQNFTEEDKKALIKIQLDICGKVLGKYRELQEKGQIEVSVTPFYHPILPLLCDTNNARIATPNINLPKRRFQHRKDAKAQIFKAVEYYKNAFGVPPKGMWPSEGSVSEDVIPLFEDAQINWIATDEEILFNSRPEFRPARQNLYQPFNIDIMGKNLNIVFRDHSLSDAIGFVYSKWDAEHAVSDFIKRIHSINDYTKGTGRANIISIILDGENCWEYYKNDGWDFLTLLYEKLSADPIIETVRISEFIERFPPTEKLKTIWPGSWINANYGFYQAVFCKGVKQSVILLRQKYLILSRIKGGINSVLNLLKIKRFEEMPFTPA